MVAEPKHNIDGLHPELEDSTLRGRVTEWFMEHVPGMDPIERQNVVTEGIQENYDAAARKIELLHPDETDESKRNVLIAGAIAVSAAVAFGYAIHKKNK